VLPLFQVTSRDSFCIVVDALSLLLQMKGPPPFWPKWVVHNWFIFLFIWDHGVLLGAICYYTGVEWWGSQSCSLGLQGTSKNSFLGRVLLPVKSSFRIFVVSRIVFINEQIPSRSWYSTKFLSTLHGVIKLSKFGTLAEMVLHVEYDRNILEPHTDTSSCSTSLC